MEHIASSETFAPHAPHDQQGPHDPCLPVPAPKTRKARAPGWQVALGKVIETEIIPRLMMSHAHENRAIHTNDLAAVSRPVADFTVLALEHSGEAAVAHIDTLLAAGTPREAIYLDLLAPAARYLGLLWESDHSDFVEVTIGLTRLQQILHRLARADDSAAAIPSRGRRILLLATPGDSHTFGITMVEQFFSAAGWNVQLADASDYLAILRRESYEIVGFSLSSHRYLDALNAAVRSVRRLSFNPAIGILAGGPAFRSNPALAGEIGADGTAEDGPSAVILAQNLLDMRAGLRR